MSRKVSEAVERLAVPILDEEGLELYDTEFTKEGKNWFLRVYIDRPEGKVDLDDCKRISERLSTELDRQDPISGAYYLEVSSPGAERPLKRDWHFKRAVGSPVFLKTYEAIDGRKKFEGKLIRYTPESVTVEIEGEPVEIPTDKVAKARRVLVL
ncbi:ribosome maturation factor RimP [Paludifilum halophilum]|uniref:Ribosome maturation factor RimP n=1 Tax=Paludifilum halophilum TaxID=1642702 RepID=A0A235BCK9_9BACL|nr:ribosome maturation factor RimP [Paludifilum halophilum]OYD09942.1 ribosome maturation factor RimP [Paludifilum halophilum]